MSVGEVLGPILDEKESIEMGWFSVLVARKTLVSLSSWGLVRVREERERETHMTFLGW